jgi:hypothetical protein
MNDEYLQKVLELAHVVEPVEQPTAKDWEKVERDLGIGLPEDLKQLVTKLGNGNFGEFCLLNPVSSCSYTQLTLQNVLEFGERVHRTAQRAGISLYPDRSGFLLIGVSGNRMELLLQPDSDCGWPYKLKWLELDYSRAHSIDMNLSRFLHDMYRGLITEDWAQEARELIWEPYDQFFSSRPGQQSA